MKSLLLFLLITPLALFAQNAKIDSLKRVIETTKVDTVKGRTLCRLCDEQRKLGNFAAAQTTGDAGLKIARKTRDLGGQAICLHALAIAHWYQSHDSIALELLDECLSSYRQIKDAKGAAYARVIMGNVYAQQGKYPQGLEHLLAASIDLQRLGDSLGAGATCNNIGIIYRRQTQYDKAFLNFRKALSLYESIQFQSGVAGAYHNIGLTHDDLKDLDSAEYYYRKSLDIEERLGNKSGMAGCLNSLGHIRPY